MNRKTIHDLTSGELKNRRVLVRVDYNVPLEDGAVTDDTRIRGTLPTLRYLVGHGARVILTSHLGRPQGKPSAEFSLKPAADRLSELIDAPVRFLDDVAGEAARAAAEALQPGQILVLENSRFLPGEEKNDPELAARFADLADVYVNDAFGAAHRAHASTAGVAEVMRERGLPAVAGLLMADELRYLGAALESPERPLVAILGGAKISGKIDVIENLLPRADHVLIGGAMANTFFKAMGLETGLSLVEEDRVDMAGELLDRAGDKLVLPVDCVVAPEATEDARIAEVDRTEVHPDARILDIGPRSVAVFGELIAQARTIVWNGPMGMFEMEPFTRGTESVAEWVAEATERGATTILGGGDTGAAAAKAGVVERMTHVSTGGGASLEFLEGKTLPGVAALDPLEGS
ncbi:MAG TPA: phosphoglycerate kinase [Longimicrobiales bacterium]|nr:phosphoglycerate kinase [Longimicrobiales bacterium]